MIHLAYQDSHGNGVPSPVDGNAATPWPLDWWLTFMPLFASYGGTVAVLPPLTKGASLGTGYDPFDHYDLGSKMQGGRRETRYGSIDTARAFVAGTRALGMQNYVNVVHHHLDGDSGDWIYRYPGADGKTLNGRFPKDIHCFWVWSPEVPINPDTVADPAWDLGFGREFRWLSGTYLDGKGAHGAGYVMRGLADALNNQTRRLAIDGYFHDDAKGTAPGYIGYVCSQQSMAGKVAFAEYSDGTTGNVTGWINRPEIHGMCGALDFPVRYKIRDICKGADMRGLMSEGICWVEPALSVPFVEDIDTDRTDPIINSKLLAYALLLTIPGYPMVFFKDLWIYGLAKPILNLIWFHETFVKGAWELRASSSSFLVYELMGDATTSGCLVGVTNRIGSYDNPADWQAVRVTSKWASSHLQDYSGHSKDQWTDAGGGVTVWIPPNEYGRGYCLFAVAGVDNPIHLAPRATPQAFYGAADLDIVPAQDGTIILGEIHAAKGSHLAANLDLALPPGASAHPRFYGPDGAIVSGTAREAGIHTIALECAGFAGASADFELVATYHARRPALQHA